MHFIRSKAFFIAGIIAVSSVFQGPSFALRMTTAAPSTNPFQQQPSHHLNTEAYLNIVQYQPKGTNLKLKDHTEFYASGSTKSKHGVIIIPDTWGWNTGRVRNICDFFGDHDTFAVVPNFSSKGIEGEHQSYMESASLMDWYKSRTFDGNIKPVICSVVNFMRNEGIEKISLVGFAWGSWVVVNLLASDIADDFQCGALSSPSIDMEEKVYGGSVPELMSRMNRPILLMPTRGDSTSYTSYMKLLKYKLPTSRVIDYHDTEANFMLRGNSDNEHIHHALNKSLVEIYSFLNEHFDKNPSDLVNERDDLGPEARVKEGRSWSEYMKQTGDQVKEGTERTGERIGEGLKHTGERIGEGTKQTGQRIEDSARSSGDRMKETSRPDKSPRRDR